jgi:hypothetical protein
MASAQARSTGTGTMSGMARPAVAAPRIAVPAAPMRESTRPLALARSRPCALSARVPAHW